VPTELLARLRRSPLATRITASQLAARLAASPLAIRLTRYTVGSAVALGTSVMVFALLYVLGVGTTADSVISFIAGAAPNWVLNRRWAWSLRGRVDWAREIGAYVAISVLAMVASSAGTGWVDDEVQRLPAHHGIRVMLVTLAYVLVQAILFVAKFLVYERWVFSGRSRVRAALRSRRQVWMAARANRTP
jgi:putative flippase GtrA